MLLLLACTATDGDSALDTGSDGPPPGPYSGHAWLTIRDRDPEPWVWSGAGFWAPQTEWTTPEGCWTTYWDANNPPEDETETWWVDAGTVEVLLDGVAMQDDTPVQPGQGFGVRASGAWFPAFEAVDAVTVPAWVDATVPEVVEKDQDVTLTWTPHEGTLFVSLNPVYGCPDSGVTTTCAFEDTGTAVLTADTIAQAREGSEGVYLGVSRSVWVDRDVQEHEVRVMATSTQSYTLWVE